MEHKQTPLQRTCVICHRPLKDDANVCPNCGHDFRPAMSGHAWESEGTPIPPIGGALIAYAGFTEAVAGLMWIFAGDFDLSLAEVDNLFLTSVLGLIAIATGAFAVAGGAYAITRRRLALALIGGVAAVTGGGVLTMYSLGALPGTTLALIGVLLISIARDEFVD